MCASKFLVAVARQHHRTPPSKEDIRAEGQRMEKKQPETYSRRRERLAGCQMLRCSEARFHTRCQKLGATSITYLPTYLPRYRAGTEQVL